MKILPHVWEVTGSKLALNRLPWIIYFIELPIRKGKAIPVTGRGGP
jgi:hypothetical protein